MFSLSRKLSWRLQVLLEAIGNHPRSLLDPCLWKVLVSSSKKILSQTPYLRVSTALCQKLRTLSAGGVLTFPIDYYGKCFELCLPSNVTDEDLLLTVDLWLPYLCQEEKALIEPELQSLEKMAYPGMAWEITGSPFREYYLNPKQSLG